MGEQTDLLPSLDSTMALIASRRSIMPKDLSGESLQKTEVKSYNEDNNDDDGYDDDDNADNGYDDDDNVNDRLRSCWRQPTGPRLITGMNHGGDLTTSRIILII